MIQFWKDKRVTVVGLGRFGGGVGVTRWLARAGARVLVTDQAPAEKLTASLEQLNDLDVTMRLGGHDERDVREADVVVVNPAVPETSPVMEAARSAGVPVTTEINLFVERCPARCVGVTGSVGKSTTTAMIGHVLGRVLTGRRVWVGGNIGRSLLEDLEVIGAGDVVVLELSSFQLQRTPIVRWSPHVAVVTNITPNHLDWHGSYDAYRAAKLSILRFQNRDRDIAVIQDDAALREAVGEVAGTEAGVWRYGLEGDVPVTVRTPGPDGDVRQRWTGLTLAVPGLHNLENAAAAASVAVWFDAPPPEVLAALRTFEALPHRLQKVVERDGVSYFDDSKSTTPEAALTALRAMKSPTLMILGGYDKGSDLEPVAREAARRARYSACVGTTGPGLAASIRAAGGEAEFFGDLGAAVAACQRLARAGDAVLLSPACASWDQFPDYWERGHVFARLARGDSGDRA